MDEPLNLHHLFVFHAVARAGNFTRAAEALVITQPAVSKQVKELERSLGVVLFDQIGRRIFLTEAGRILDEYATTLFGIAGDARRTMGELQDLERGTLAIAASETIGMYLLPAVLGAFHERFPGIVIQLRVANTAAVVEAVAAYATEIGFVEGPAGNPRIELREIASDELVIAVPAGSPLAGADQVAPSGLRDVPFVLREAGSGTRATADAFLAAAGIAPRVVAEVDNIESLKRVVAAGLGCTVLSTAAIASDVQSGRLIAKRLTGSRMVRQLSIATLRERRLSAAAREFLDITTNVIPAVLRETNAG